MQKSIVRQSMHYFNHADFNEDLKKDFTDANKQMKAYTEYFGVICARHFGQNVPV